MEDAKVKGFTELGRIIRMLRGEVLVVFWALFGVEAYLQKLVIVNF